MKVTIEFPSPKDRLAPLGDWLALMNDMLHLDRSLATPFTVRWMNEAMDTMEEISNDLEIKRR